MSLWFWPAVLAACALLALVLCLVFWFSLDSDLVLWLADKLGRDPKSLRGRIIWITGASSGIGEALAHKLAQSGAKLILSGRNVDNLNEVKRNCVGLLGKTNENDVFCLPFDLRDAKNHQAIFDQALAAFGRIDVLVNNAGRSQRALFHETSTDVDRDMFDVNVFSLINLSRIVLNYWYSTNIEGHFVVTSSITGKFGLPNAATYCATKHALHGYFESIRNEGHKKNIKVTMVCPGPVFSNLAERAFTATPGQTFGVRHGEDAKRMKTSRCAHLMAVAIANQLNEVWICFQPILTLYYFSQYLPGFSRRLFPLFVGMERISKYREGTDVNNV